MQQPSLRLPACASTPARLPKDPPSLALAAQAGDRAALAELVCAYDRRLRRAVAAFGLGLADVDDVLQSTWLCALTGLHALKCPEAVGAWLTVTARRQALRRLQRHLGEVLVDEPPDVETRETPVDVVVGSDDESAILRDAIDRLPDRQRQLLRALIDHPDASYAELSSRLGMPIGAIGPTRERAISRLRADAHIAALRPAPTPATHDVGSDLAGSL